MRRITDLKLLWVEGFMWGLGGQFLYNTGTDKNGSAHNQIRITIQGADEKKKEVEEEEEERF